MGGSNLDGLRTLSIFTLFGLSIQTLGKKFMGEGLTAHIVALSIMGIILWMTAIRGLQIFRNWRDKHARTNIVLV